MGISNELTRLQQTLVVVYSRPDPKAPGSADLFCDLYQKRVLLWNRNATEIALLAYSPLGDRSAAKNARVDRDSKKWREICILWSGRVVSLGEDLHTKIFTRVTSVYLVPCYFWVWRVFFLIELLLWECALIRGRYAFLYSG